MKISWKACASLGDAVVRATPWLLIPAALLAYAVVVPVHAPVIIPCTFKLWTGWPCPFCGMTRSFTAAGHGSLPQSIHESPLGFILFLACAGVVVLCALAIVRKRSFTLDWEGRGRVVLVLGVLLVLANWLYRLACGLN